MKKKNLHLIFLILSIFTYSTTFAQTEKGIKLLGGSADISSTSFDSDSENIFGVSVNPNIGFFLVDNFALGAEVPLGFTSSDISNTTQVGLVPFARYYLGSSDTRKFFLGVRGGIVSSNVSFDSGDDISRNQGVVGANAGVAFFINQSIALETALNYQYISIEDSNGVSNIGLSVGFQIHFGSSGE